MSASLRDASSLTGSTELADGGYAKLTMEGVAARAHTGKQVLYRRWRNRAELVIAAVRHHHGSLGDRILDTGQLRTDVLAVLGHMAQRRLDIGAETIHGLLAEVPDLDPGLFTIMRDVMVTVLENAAERGEIATADLPPRVVTLPIDMLRHQLLLTREPIDETTLTEITDDVFLPLVRAHKVDSRSP